jgi:hypothetical protein
MEEESMPQANNNAIIPALPRALPRDARRKVETAIEQHLAAVHALTAFLDEADSDPDLEPSLAGTGGDDREYDPADPPAHEGIDDNELDGSGCPSGSEDEEPDLGWTGDINQERAHQGLLRCQVFNHREAEHDGREPDADREPEDGI